MIPVIQMTLSCLIFAVNLYYLALAQVIAYIVDRWVSVSTPVLFKFSELNKLYCELNSLQGTKYMSHMVVMYS